MYQTLLDIIRELPPPYATNGLPFGDDDHISKSMLEAHLNPDTDGASRRPGFIEKSVRWIAALCPPEGGKRLIDLGCGPGLYAERFCRAGFRVTGVDFSRRSIAYAVASAARNCLPVRYLCQSYLSLEFDTCFDVATLIYCDYGVLAPDCRSALLQRVRRALRAGGSLILDGFTPREASFFKEGQQITYEPGGFWSPEPYACLRRNVLYPETGNSLEQYVVVTAEDLRCYNLWNQYFSPASLLRELHDAGFTQVELYGDVCGAPLSQESRTLCAVAR